MRLALLVLVMSTTLAAQTGFTPLSDRRPGVIVEGHFQSCPDGDDGGYGERVYDGTGFELHLGPSHEFAYFRGNTADHRQHDAKANLLRPYELPLKKNRAAHTWHVDNLTIDVALAGGSDDRCESWIVSVVKRPIRIVLAYPVLLEPAFVRLQIIIAPHADNRSLSIEADGENFYRESAWTVDGEKAPHVYVVEWRDLPAGNYALRARLQTTSGVSEDRARLTVNGRG